MAFKCKKCGNEKMSTYTGKKMYKYSIYIRKRYHRCKECGDTLSTYEISKSVFDEMIYKIYESEDIRTKIEQALNRPPNE